MLFSALASRFSSTNVHISKYANRACISRRKFIRKCLSQELATKIETESSDAWSEEEESTYDRQILDLALPTLCSNLLLPLSNSIDAGVVGQLGPAQMSGVGLSSMTLIFLTSFLSFIPLLITPIIAQKDARGESTSQDIAQGIKLSLFLGVAAGSFAFLSAESILKFLKPSIGSVPFAILYLKTLAFLPPAALTVQCLGGVFRGLKDNRPVLKASILSVGVNVALDYFFVFGLGWSVFGVGLATIISMYTALGYLSYQLVSQGKLKLSDLKTPFDLDRIMPMMFDGVRLGMKGVLMFGMFLTSATLISQKGMIAHSAYEICRQMGTLTYVIYASIEQTVQALSATALGYENFKMGRTVILRSIKLAVGICSLTVMTLVLFSKQVAGFYTGNSAVIAAFVTVAPFHLLTMPITAMVSVIDGALIGAQKSRIVATAQSIGSMLGILALLLLNWKDSVTLMGVWVVIRFGITMHGLVTGHYLFFSKRSPYGFALE
eukprot:g7703.t1